MWQDWFYEASVQLAYFLLFYGPLAVLVYVMCTRLGVGYSPPLPD